VRDGTRALVEDAAARLGYMPNPAARSLVTGQTNTIALVVSEPETRLFSDPFFPAVVHGIASAIADSDLQLVLLLAHTEREHGKVERYVRQRHVDGVILMSLHGEDALPRRLVEAGVPTVLSGRPAAAAQPIPYVDADNRGGGRAAAEHLLARGAKTIATVTGPLDMTAAVDRYEGYRDALADRPPLVANADFTVEGGERAMRELLARAPDLDAVFVASDLMAVGALIALRALGRRVPADVAVVGFDDVPLAAASEPPLTTVRQPLEAMSHALVDLLAARIAGGAGGDEHVTCATQLVRRASA
jgi:DNA-binding LacI/PurR family transcriptional regulator